MYEPDNYLIASKLFIHLLGIIYFFAFGALIPQIRGLIGRNGILPIERYLYHMRLRLGKRCYYYLPSVFWFNASDTALMAVTITGTILSMLLFLGIAPPVILLLVYILYLSIVSTGQDFLSFGWDMFLMEITINAIFLSCTDVPNLFMWISLNFLLFRFHFQAGTVKIQSGDKSWATLTATCYHYQTQPIPNTQAWFFHKLPRWFQKVSCLLVLVVEILIPVATFGNEEIRLGGFICLVSLQFLIWFTGNFSYLNYLTTFFCVILLSDRYLEPIFGPAPTPTETPLLGAIAISCVGCILIALQLIRMWTHFIWNPRFAKILKWISPFHLAHRYGIFAVMTTKRYEVVVEGSNDGKQWKEYTFKYKPSEVTRRPRRISPYQPRIDWQAWFLPFSNFHSEQWFINFLYRLLEGSPQVLKLLRNNPFPNKPPKYIRARLYDYTFTDFETKRKTGQWWNRVLVERYSPTLMQIEDNQPKK